MKAGYMYKGINMLTLILLAALSLSTYVGIDNVRDKSAQVMEDVGESVYLVQNNAGHGTGWVARTKSGMKVMVTNVHVCENEMPIMWTEKNGVRTMMKVLFKDDKHDICLLTAPVGSVPLELADNYEPETNVYLVGFPIIEYMTSNKGLLKGLSMLQMPYNLPVSKCKASKYKIYKIPMQQRDGSVKVQDTCVFEAPVVVTTANTDAGGSGSPMLNEKEEVVGMVMVTAGNIAWGQGVPLDALKEFLNKH
jgi:S1-C subfamily serine protease